MIEESLDENHFIDWFCHRIANEFLLRELKEERPNNYYGDASEPFSRNMLEKLYSDMRGLGLNDDNGENYLIVDPQLKCRNDIEILFLPRKEWSASNKIGKLSNFTIYQSKEKIINKDFKFKCDSPVIYSLAFSSKAFRFNPLDDELIINSSKVIRAVSALPVN